MQILLVEDDSPQAEAVRAALTNARHEITRVDTGEKAVIFLEKNFVDLVILDWRLPGMSGLEVLGWIRHRLGDQPGVLFLTSKVLEIDIVQALESGADEYIVKPFRQSELIARVNALRRRLSNDAQSSSTLRLGRYVLDIHNRHFLLDGQLVTLTDKEFDMAVVMFKHPGRIISRDLLARLAWGREHDGASRTIDTHISRIRRKLSLGYASGVRLVSVYTHGYRLIESDLEAPGAPETSEAGDNHDTT
ncbi:response regulator transcription factor [Paraburkholderia sp.]|uniref:response regulator transcription factor n=1 Tax=Paraburkholderia sp. TaxID=1926495 RepID=UPI003D6E0D10